MTTTLTPETFRRKVLEEPEWYLREVLGERAWWKQVEIVRSVLHRRRTAVAGCVGSSKTRAAAQAIHAFMDAYQPAEVYTTAPTFRQVKKVLWKEIRKIHKKSKLPRGGKLLDTEWKIDDDWFAIGFSPKDPDSVHGAHAVNILIVLDEAQGISQEIIEATENAMAGGNAHLLMLFNPSATSGETYDAQTSKSGAGPHQYNFIRIAADQTPNWLFGKTVIPGMIEPDQAKEWIRTFGWDSNFVRVKVRALPPKQSADTVIPIEWIEAAMNREASRKGLTVQGVDVARFGDDNSVIASMEGRQILPLEVIRRRNTMVVAGRVKQRQEKTGARTSYIDVIGIGAGVVDRLKEQKVRCVGVNTGGKARDPRKFVNRRSELWFKLRDAMDPDSEEPIGLPRDLELMAELSSVKYSVDSQGRQEVESKKIMKKRLKRSPDRADAVMMALFAATAGLPTPGATGGGSKATGATAAGGPKRRTTMRDTLPDSSKGIGNVSGFGRSGISRLRDRMGM